MLELYQIKLKEFKEKLFKSTNSMHLSIELAVCRINQIIGYIKNADQWELYAEMKNIYISDLEKQIITIKDSLHELDSGENNISNSIK